MNNMTEVLHEILNLGERALSSNMGSRLLTAVFAVILIFGVLNCVLGYRLLRFWMMLGGFFTGGALAFVILNGMGNSQTSTYLAGMLITGIVFAVIAFLIYKVGVFILAAGIGWTLSIYFIHPTTSAIFFACVLIGVALGSLAVKYCREVLIIATSLIGGVMAGVSLAQLGNLENFPYGVGMSLGFGILGILIQFAINKPREEEAEEPEPVKQMDRSEYPEENRTEKRKSARPDGSYMRYTNKNDRHTGQMEDTENEEER